MRPSKLTYYSDFFVYPLVITGLAAAGIVRKDWLGPGRWLTAVLVGFIIWTLAEYVLHRSVLHTKTYFAPMHGEHHASPLSFIGTPFWVSVVVLLACVFLPVWRWTGFAVANGLTVGVMVGYWWYGIVHHFIHHHAGSKNSAYFNELRAWHMRHHYSPRRGNFGVTTSLWDRVFRTAIRSQEKAATAP